VGIAEERRRVFRMPGQNVQEGSLGLVVAARGHVAVRQRATRIDIVRIELQRFSQLTFRGRKLAVAEKRLTVLPPEDRVGRFSNDRATHQPGCGSVVHVRHGDDAEEVKSVRLFGLVLQHGPIALRRLPDLALLLPYHALLQELPDPRIAFLSGQIIAASLFCAPIFQTPLPTVTIYNACRASLGCRSARFGFRLATEIASSPPRVEYDLS
jgi:hypothetical protein